MDIGGFLSACASGDIGMIKRLARGLDPDSGRDVLAQGITVATMSGATGVVEFLQPIADELGLASGVQNASSCDPTADSGVRKAEEESSMKSRAEASALAKSPVHAEQTAKPGSDDREPETAQRPSADTATASPSKWSASEALRALLTLFKLGGPSARAIRVDLIDHFASFGSEALDVLDEYLGSRGPSEVDEKSLRFIRWSVGRIGEHGAGRRVLEFALSRENEEELLIQALRALSRPHVAEGVDLEGFADWILPQLKAQSDGNRLAEDIAIAVMLCAQTVPLDGEMTRARAAWLIGRLDLMMRWDQRIQTEREYGLLEQGLDPLFERMESLLRSIKGPYCFREAVERSSRLYKKGMPPGGLVPTESQISRIGIGDGVTLLLEQESEDGWHVSVVRARVSEPPQDSAAGRLFVGRVEAVEPWDGSYTLEEGERVHFLGLHILGVVT